ncbi:hypothetical protein [Streptomyces sp. GbtcB6]|uniref:DUF7919 family protein n=1 Tax=Streptomyces sp. GbtcB6 TaxID=2824751 RepID=UPI001C2FC558|nr:hypothetical protein [Streptomyces sp. GbtcB6]
MTHYSDLSLYDFDFYSEPEGLTVGWLEGDQEFTTGDVSADDLAILADIGRLKQKKSRGYHYCTICTEKTDRYAESPRFGTRYQLGSAEIRVVSDDGTLYVAPNLIIHYISDHGYLPPAEFISAVRVDARRRWPVS